MPTSVHFLPDLYRSIHWQVTVYISLRASRRVAQGDSRITDGRDNSIQR